MLKPFAITIAAIFSVLGDLPAKEEAIQTARDHLKAVLQCDFETLEKTSAATVVLMPGHEFLIFQMRQVNQTWRVVAEYLD